MKTDDRAILPAIHGVHGAETNYDTVCSHLTKGQYLDYGTCPAPAVLLNLHLMIAIFPRALFPCPSVIRKR